MTAMECLQEDVMALRVQSIRNSYAELFLLLNESANEDPLTQPDSGLDQAIERLMVTIDQTMKEFRGDVARAEALGALSPVAKALVIELDGQLRQGLELMVKRVDRRIAELSETREQLKDRLLLVRRKGQGAKGYRGRLGQSTLIKSQV